MPRRVTDLNRIPARQPEKPRRTFAFPVEPRRSQYGPESLASVRPLEEPNKRRELRIPLPRLGSRKLLVPAMALIVVMAGATVFFARDSQHDPIPASIKQKAGFTLYYPKSLPAGFHFDEASYDPSTKVVTYDYATNGGNKLYFSLQPKPSSFNFDNFNKKQLSGAHQTSTPIGTATIGILQQETVSSVVTDKTWIIISAGEKINLDQLEQVSKSLTPAKQ